MTNLLHGVSTVLSEDIEKRQMGYKEIINKINKQKRSFIIMGQDLVER